MHVVEAAEGARLAAVPGDEVTAAFRTHGLVVFRGFGAGPADFDAFARPFTREYFFGYGRAVFPDFRAITTVNETQLPLEPHCDNGIRPEPQRPEVTWFLCERPAAADGETTFFDGIRVWDGLTPATRALLEARPISYLSRVAEPAWRALGCSSPEQFVQFVGTVGGTPKTIHADGTIDVEVLSPAVRRPRWTERLAFVSSMLVAGSRGFEGMSVTLDGGEPIPKAVYDDVRAALAACLEEVRWRAGDVAMLDNTRFVHGRRGFTDPERRLYLIQTLRASF
jgi:alpha-ketoglutarate-dependent taurine dioxygenase